MSAYNEIVSRPYRTRNIEWQLDMADKVQDMLYDFENMSDSEMNSYMLSDAQRWELESRRKQKAVSW